MLITEQFWGKASVSDGYFVFFSCLYTYLLQAFSFIISEIVPKKMLKYQVNAKYDSMLQNLIIAKGHNNNQLMYWPVFIV